MDWGALANLGLLVALAAVAAGGGWVAAQLLLRAAKDRSDRQHLRDR